MAALFSVWYWTFFAISSMVLFLIALLIWLVTFPFDPTRRVLHRFTCWWSLLYVRCLPGCRLVVEGQEKIQPGVTYVLVANHQSLTDVMALGAIACPFKWVSKKEIFRIPFIGWNGRLNQYVSVDRGNVRNVRQTLTECRAWLERGVSLMMFPEGTRSKDGSMHEFHVGSFKLAGECGCPVVPIVVDGTLPIYQGWKVMAFPGTITIRVLDPITQEEAGGKAAQLCAVVFARMQQELAAIRQGKASLASPVAEKPQDPSTESAAK
jgi:1-acyl-sn-glycerol-3-phosphate acyltransferase